MPCDILFSRNALLRALWYQSWVLLALGILLHTEAAAKEDVAARFLSEAPTAREEATGFQDQLQGRYTKERVDLSGRRQLSFHISDN